MTDNGDLRTLANAFEAEIARAGSGVIAKNPLIALFVLTKCQAFLALTLSENGMPDEMIEMMLDKGWDVAGQNQQRYRKSLASMPPKGRA